MGEREDSSISLDWDEVRGATLGRMILIRKLKTENVLNRTIVRNMISKGWNILKGWRFHRWPKFVPIFD